jgi:hypothetical protein
MSVSDPGEKIEWGADSELRKNERVPSSAKAYPDPDWYSAKMLDPESEINESGSETLPSRA